MRRFQERIFVVFELLDEIFDCIIHDFGGSPFVVESVGFRDMAVGGMVSGAAGTFEVFSFFVETLSEGGENIFYSVYELEF